MALIIEDGSIVAGATSYVSETEYRAWADARFGDDRSSAPSNDAAAEKILLRAMDYLESLDFIGVKAYQNQSLQWPRSWVCIDGYPIEANEIPAELKNSLYELAYAEETGEGMNNSIDRLTESESVGPIKVSYAASSARSILPSISNALKKILKNSGGFSVTRI